MCWHQMCVLNSADQYFQINKESESQRKWPIVFQGANILKTWKGREAHTLVKVGKEFRIFPKTGHIHMGFFIYIVSFDDWYLGQCPTKRS